MESFPVPLRIRESLSCPPAHPCGRSSLPARQARLRCGRAVALATPAASRRQVLKRRAGQPLTPLAHRARKANSRPERAGLAHAQRGPTERTRRRTGRRPARMCRRTRKKRAGVSPTRLPCGHSRPSYDVCGAMVISTRRFAARPASLSLDAIGWVSPMPATKRRSRMTPREIRSPATALARRSDKR